MMQAAEKGLSGSRETQEVVPWPRTTVVQAPLGCTLKSHALSRGVDVVLEAPGTPKGALSPP